jgi:hypothetical protein
VAALSHEEELHNATSRLSLGNGSPSLASKPLPPTPTPSTALPLRSHSSASYHSLDGPIDFSTIWEIDPPEIQTGLVQPAPVRQGEFVLLDDDAATAASFGTGLTGRASRYTAEVGGPDWIDGQERYEGRYGSDEDYEDDVDETASSPTSASGRDLPLASTFGSGKWSEILLPSETILMLSEVLQRPASSAAAARTAILRGPQKLKFPALNPRNLISSSPSNNSLLSAGAPPSASALSSSPSSAASGASLSSPPLHSQLSPPSAPAALPHHAGSKPRTLILTDYPRLLCLKESPAANKISVKSEVFLGSALRGGVRREGVSAFICVEPAGKEEGRGFVVKTVRPYLVLSCSSVPRADASLSPSSLLSDDDDLRTVLAQLQIRRTLRSSFAMDCGAAGGASGGVDGPEPPLSSSSFYLPTSSPSPFPPSILLHFRSWLLYSLLVLYYRMLPTLSCPSFLFIVIQSFSHLQAYRRFPPSFLSSPRTHHTHALSVHIPPSASLPCRLRDSLYFLFFSPHVYVLFLSRSTSLAIASFARFLS